MSFDYQQDIAQLTEQMRPASILVLGGECSIFNHYLNVHPFSRLVCVSHGDYIASVDALGRVDLAYVSGVLERMNKHDAGVLLSKLRDVHAQRVVVAVHLGRCDGQRSTWSEQELLAFGMSRIGRYANADNEIQVFTFDLHDYKPTPDWLNSHGWAHPELFDKHWW